MVNKVLSDGAQVYLDTNIFIYLLESDTYPAMRDIITALFSACDNGRLAPVTSALTLAEVLPAPLRHRNDTLVRGYRELLTNTPTISVIPITLPILDAAAVIRSQSSNKLPDAIHIATALHAGCDWFVTNDKQLNIPGGLPLQTLLLADDGASQSILDF